MAASAEFSPMTRIGYHQLGNNGQFYVATVKPTVGFSASGDAEKLHLAMKGLGTNEAAIISVLGRRTNNERQEIKESFVTYYKTPLLKEIISETSGDFRILLKMLLHETSYMLAKALYHAMKGIGTKETVLNEILISATNQDIISIKQAYKAVLADKGADSSRTLEGDIKSDTSGDYQIALLTLLDGQRDEPNPTQLKQLISKGTADAVNKDLAKQDAKMLFDAGQRRVGTNENVFIQIFCHRLPWQIAACATVYPEFGGISLRDAIKSETSGDFCQFLLDSIDYALKRPLYYATKLNKCIAGLGTNDIELMRLIVSRSEIDLETIKEAYVENFRESLDSAIKGDTSGDYKMLLLTLAAKCDK